MNLEHLFFDGSESGESWPQDLVNQSLGAPPAEDILRSTNLDDIDSGLLLQTALQKYTARIRHLKAELISSKKETDNIADDTLMQNLELLTLNESLELKVKERTQELASSYTELEKQSQLLQELAEIKDALMHMIVHDMKNPLTAILGTLHLFHKNPGHLPPQLHELLVSARVHGLTLLSMIEEILIVSRMQSQEFKLQLDRWNLISVIRKSVDMMAKTVSSKQLSFCFSPLASELKLVMDGQLIERVLNNLLNNAIKYSPRQSDILLEVAVMNNLAEIKVTNWGPTIPEKYHQSVFDLFCRVDCQSTKFSGTGLGLTFCKLAVEAHGGNISLVSPVPGHDQGVVFCFTLPLNIPIPPAPATPPETGQ